MIELEQQIASYTKGKAKSHEHKNEIIFMVETILEIL